MSAADKWSQRGFSLQDTVQYKLSCFVFCILLNVHIYRRVNTTSLPSTTSSFASQHVLIFVFCTRSLNGVSSLSLHFVSWCRQILVQGRGATVLTPWFWHATVSQTNVRNASIELSGTHCLFFFSRVSGFEQHFCRISISTPSSAALLTFYCHCQSCEQMMCNRDSTVMFTLIFFFKLRTYDLMQ